MTSKKHNKVCNTLSYIEPLLILTYAVTGYVSISSFAFLIGIPVGIARPGKEIEICAITSVIKKYKSIIKKKKKKQYKTVQFPKTKLNSIDVSRDLIDSNNSHVDFFVINNMLREYDNVKKKIPIKKNAHLLIKQLIVHFLFLH